MSRFSTLAKQAFSFLADDEFRLVKCEENLLRYESRDVVVSVSLEPPQFGGGLDVLIGHKAPDKGKTDQFSLFLIVDMQMSNGSETHPFMAGDEDKLVSLVERLARDTKAYAASALKGDRMFFRRLKVFRAERAKAYHREMELKRVRSEAEHAWRARDFQTLVRLYSAIEDDLTTSEAKKLSYAKKHLMP